MSYGYEVCFEVIIYIITFIQTTHMLNGVSCIWVRGMYVNRIAFVFFPACDHIRVMCVQEVTWWLVKYC